MNKKNLEDGKRPSAIRSLFEYAKAKKKENPDFEFFDFSIGNPSVPAPKIVTDTLNKLLLETPIEKLHGYTSSNGDEEVRKSIAKYLSEKYHTEIDYRYIYMSAGAASSLALALNSILEEGDEVIVNAPYFAEYDVLVGHARGKLIKVPSNKDFLPDIEAIEKAINPKTAILLIDSPNNPTGVFYDEKVIISLTNLLRKKEIEFAHPIYLLSDEPYRELLYNGEEYPFVTRYYDNSVVCYSFSKSLSLPGERIGYVLISPKAKEKDDLVAALRGSARAIGHINAPSLFQYMVPYVLGHTSDLNIYKENRDLLYNALTKLGYEVIYPSGAFYLFMKALEEDANKFSDIAKEYGLILVPSDTFGIKGYVRLAYCVNKETVINSLPAFEKLYRRYK